MTPRRYPDYGLIAALFFAAAALMIVIFAPQSHNPDGNFYFGTALRLSRGEFGASIEAMYPPLLSWLMAPLIASGLSLNAAFRIVNLGAFVATVMLTHRLTLALKMPPLLGLLVVGLTGVQLLYFTVVLVTGDLLATPFYLAMCLILLRACGASAAPRRAALQLGVLGALGYYAKAMQLPIAMLALAGTGLLLGLINRSRRGRIFRITFFGALCCALFSAPWIFALSQKYGTPIFTGQQLQQLGVTSVHDYSPDDAERIAAEIRDSKISAQAAVNRSLSVSRPDAGRLRKSLPYLCEVTCGLLFGGHACIWYGILLLIGWTYVAITLPRRPELSPVFVFQLAQICAYMVVWGAYIRYFFPALALAHLCAAYGIWAVWQAAADAVPAERRLARACIKGFALLGACLVMLSVTRTTLLSIADDWRKKDDGVIAQAASLPMLSEQRGIITGNGESPIPGMIAYRLKREYWASLYAAREHDPAALGAKLRRWNVAQIIWDGAPPAVLESVPGLARRGTFSIGASTLSIYEFAPQ